MSPAFQYPIPEYLKEYLEKYEKSTCYSLSNMQPEHIGLWPLKQSVLTSSIFDRLIQFLDNTIYSRSKQAELHDILAYLLEIALPVFVLGMEKNPIHHNVQTAENMLKIVTGQKKPYKFARKAVVLALLHDIGNGLVDPGLKKIKISDIKDRRKQMEKEKRSKKEIKEEEKKLIAEADIYRRAHMNEGAKIAGRLIAELNDRILKKKNRRIDNVGIREIEQCIKIHDVPSIAEGYTKLGKTIPYSLLIPFKNGPGDDRTLPDFSDLANMLREADRLWMVSREGLEKDLFDDLKKEGTTYAFEKLKHNCRRFKEEYDLYKKAKSITPKHLARFKGGTLFRNSAAFGLFRCYVSERIRELVVDNFGVDVMGMFIQATTIATEKK